VAQFLNVDQNSTVKAMIFKVDSEKYCMALIRGDYEVNEVKLKNVLKASEVEIATDEEIKELGLEKGYLGPIGIKDIKIVVDSTVVAMKNYVSGANEIDKHYLNTNHNRDYEIDLQGDIRTVKLEETCPRCEQGKLKSARGIEVGQIFKLGTKYSKALGAKYTNEEGKGLDMVMGCYGIGVSRTMAAAVEQNYDDYGIIWPMSIAPYHVDIIPANIKDNEQMRIANRLYETMMEEGIEVILDDRNERPGFKFKDADLIGFPLKIIVGKSVTAGKVELKYRKSGEKEEIEIENIIEYIKKVINDKI